MTFFALLRYRPMVLMYASRPSTPSAWMAAGVLATGNSLAVALFTPTSVAWAERITATSSSKVLAYSSSVVGSGLSSFRRRKISARLAAFIPPLR
ncbi:hypothetical protein D3C78_1396900 [compost metagenome]